MAHGRVKTPATMLLLPGVAALVAAAIFGSDWRDAVALRTLLTALVYAYAIALPAALLLPPVLSRAGRHPARLVLATAVTLLPLVAFGCLLAGAVLVAVGLGSKNDFWPTYFRTVRMASIMGVLISTALAAYESMASQLEMTRRQAEQSALERERALKLALEARLASLESRIHPHFLFNTLNSISALIPVDAARAEQLVERLAVLLRGSLDTAQRSLIPLADELVLVESYLGIESARFGERLRFQFTIPETARKQLVPPLSVECLVENAVRYGVAPQASGGEVEIAARIDGRHLYIDVSDTGPGFELAAVPSGHGLDNLTSRLEVLYGADARLEVARRKCHTVATLVVPAS